MLRRLNVLMGVLALVVAACGGDDPPTGPDPSVAPFVGTWEATTFTVTSIDDPPEMRDLLSNGSFTINVQPSGLYTATLLLGELTPIVEIGQLEIVSDGVLILRPDGSNPCPASSEYSFSGPDQVTLRGPTCVDFNLDGTDEDAVALIVLMRS
jgi:hypothetical protein